MGFFDGAKNETCSICGEKFLACLQKLYKKDRWILDFWLDRNDSGASH